MFGFIGFILIFILVIVLFVFAILGNIVRAIFGLGRRAPKHFYGNNTTSSQENTYTYSQRSQQPSANGKKKIFADDEGEYVEYEEVK